MATTKIWAVKDNFERTVNYAANPKKTVDSDLKKAIHYAGDEAKTLLCNGRKLQCRFSI